MTKLFVLAMLALTLFSCSKENENIGSPENKTISLALKVQQGSFTKSLQTPGATGQSINSMILEVFDASKNKIAGKNLSASEISAAMSDVDGSKPLDDASRIVIEGIDSRAAYIKIWAFQKSSITASVDLTTSINNHQTAFNEIPFYPIQQTVGSTPGLLSTTDSEGFISINKSESPAPGPGAGSHSEHKIWTVQTTLRPYFARFEVKPTPGSGIVADETAGNFPAGTTIKVTGIYINNINDAKSDANVTTFAGNHANWGTGDWADNNGYYGNGTPSWTNMYNAPGGNNHLSATAIDFSSQPDCYNLFAQAGSPHVIVRVLVDLPAATDYYGFITIKDFNITGGNSEKLSAKGIQSGKIYQMALDITVKPKDITPDPESTAADLYASVTILDWTEVKITPEL